jgi:thioredoxin 1
MADKVVKVTDADFETVVLQSKLPVLVDFWAEWCAPCHVIAPEVEAISEELAGRTKVAKLEIEENPETAAEHGVMSIPTLVLFVDGVERTRMTGARRREAIRAEIEPHLESIAQAKTA